MRNNWIMVANGDASFVYRKEKIKPHGISYMVCTFILPYLSSYYNMNNWHLGYAMNEWINK